MSGRLAAFFSLLCVASPAFAEDLARAGRFNGKIFVAPDAAPDERAAAAMLALWFSRVAGVRPEIATAAAGEKSPGVYLGDTDPARAEGVSPPPIVSREAFVRESKSGGRLFLVGGSPRATRFAAAKFVQENLGVNFLMPGDFGADWAPRARIVLPEGREVFTPAFAWRALVGLDAPEEREWALNMGLGALPEFQHALWNVFDEAAFRENPAMFPMRAGATVAPSKRGGYEPQPNLANPDSALHAAKRAHEFFKKNPDAPTFSLSINDNMTWDDSPASCAEFAKAGSFRNRPDYSDYVFRFMNRAAEALEALEKADGSPPGGALAGYAYYHCENAPSFAVHPRVFPVLTADRSEWRDKNFAAEDAALMRRWSRSGAKTFGVYDYYYGFAMPAPRVFLKAEADSIRCASENGAALFYAELFPDWGFDGPKAWLAARLIANPKEDPERLIGVYFDSGYGPAAGAMRRFFARAESRFADAPLPPHWIRFYRNESMFALFPANARVEMRSDLAEALRAFEPPPLSPRMRRMKARVVATLEAFARFDGHAAWYESRRELDAIPPAKNALEARAILTAHEKTRRAEREFLMLAAARNASPLRVGAPFSPGSFWRFDAASAACAKLGDFWREAREEDTGVSLRGAATLAEKPSSRVEILTRETFSPEAFRPARAGTWAAAKGLSIPKSPWSANLFEAAGTRFGASDLRSADGDGSLLFAGGDSAKISRAYPAEPGDFFGFRLKHSGRLIPGLHLELGCRFLNAAGGELGSASTLAFPCDDDAWRVLALGAGAPAGTARVEVFIRLMNEEKDDAIWIDDFEARQLPAGVSPE